MGENEQKGMGTEKLLNRIPKKKKTRIERKSLADVCVVV